MDAWVLRESPGDYVLAAVPEPVLGAGDVRVKVITSALNHMDIWLTQGRPRPHLPHVPGCDVAGVVEEVGQDVRRDLLGAEVVVNPAVSCRRCRVCLSGESPLCREFQIVGEHRWGGHGASVVVPMENVSPRPQGLSWEQSAAFGLAGLTAWRMLRRGRLQAGETVLIVGVGGGVSSAALALAVHMGAHVVVTSRDPDKRATALERGAAQAVSSDDERWDVAADVVVESVGPATWDRSIRALRPGGRLVVCGGTSGPTVEVSLPRLFFKQHEIIGSTMGSYEEWAQVVELMNQGVPVAVDEVFELGDYPRALSRLHGADQLGKIVLRH
ncbi:MAG: zinc-binding dehydrogenase [Actinobacteria bacterium]|nr:zinc-binding dehydrogenase [Actinomycetota bacterium]MBI3256328.1 zinc-binding dehydrogenase [Actinomycetota bacterium]